MYNPHVVAITSIPLTEQQHLHMDGVEWPFYERVLEQAGNGPMRVTFAEGSIEIMAPLPEHELAKRVIGSLIDTMSVELKIPMRRYGSTTFRRADRQVGLEPDECYYIANESKVRRMKRFDPAEYPPPDLAIEIDITARSIPRQPIYALLGVPELWRYDGKRLTVLALERGRYKTVARSLAFPLLPMKPFEAYVHRMESEEQTAVLVEFQAWVRGLPA